MANQTLKEVADDMLANRLIMLAEVEHCSMVDIANKAVSTVAEEREATNELIRFSLDNIDMLDRYGSDDVMAWLRSPDGTPFPQPLMR